MAKFVPKINLKPNTLVKPKKTVNNKGEESVLNEVVQELNPVTEFVEDVKEKIIGEEKELEDRQKEFQKKEDALKEKYNSLQKHNDVHLHSDVFGAFAYIFQDVAEVFKREVNKYKATAVAEQLETLRELKEGYDKNGVLDKELIKNSNLLDKTKDVLLSATTDIAKTVAVDLATDTLPKNEIFKNIVDKSKTLLNRSKNSNITDILAGKIIDNLEETPKVKDTDKDVDEEVVRDRQKDNLKDFDRLRASAPKLRAR